MPILSVNKVSKIYNKSWVALTDIDLSVDEGEFVFLVGPSGAGKTTLLNLILAQDFPDSGTVEVAGFNSDTLTKAEIPLLRRKLGVIFQDFKLLPDLTAFENVAFALRVCAYPGKLVKSRTKELLASVGLLHKENSYPSELSGGERQKIAIARALVHSPLLLLADEPTGNIDPHSTEEIMSLLLDINRQGTAIIMATHNMELVENFGFRVIEISEGFLVGDRKRRKER
jgi:cell division transport system ATP-binding protein